MPKKIYITTAIAYVNAKPHIGFALECLQADCVARYQRLKGSDVFFVSGADENSLKNVLAAEKEGKPVQDFVDEYSQNFFELKKALNLSFDDFIRTTEKRHILGAKKFWENAQKDIYQGEYEGLYCVGCEDFKKEGDLAEKGLCPDHKTRPEQIKEKNYFFRLKNYQSFLEEVFEKEEIKIVPENRKAGALNFLREGLKDFSISRSQERAHNWGIKTPGDDFQIIYVWFDALCNYITVLGYKEDASLFQNWWQDETAEVWHFIGKDIIKFHAIYWPAMLRSAGLRLPSKLVVHGFLTSEGEKISKSLGNVLDPFDLVQEYGLDPVRFYLLREFSLAQDGDFKKDDLVKRYNGELANGLGNLLSRVLALIEKNGGEVKIKDEIFPAAIAQTWQNYDNFFSEFKINKAAESWLGLISQADAFINEKKPWEIKDKEELNKILSSLWVVLANLSFLARPFMPETSDKIRDALGMEEINNLSDLPNIKDKIFKIKKINSLFPRR